MRKTLVARSACILLLGLLSGCATWVEKQQPETPEERKAVADMTERLLKTPQSLAGHDQDWDDAIAAANQAAMKTLCRRRLYEMSASNQWTGRIREVQ